MVQDNAAEDQDTIDEIAELDDDALDEQLKDAMKADTDEEEKKESDDKGEKEDPEKEEESDDDDKGEKEDPEKEEESDDDDKGDEEKETPEEALKRELAEAKAEKVKLEEQLAEKEIFAQSKANAEGELKKQLAEARGKTRLSDEEINALHDEDPAKATQAQIDRALADVKTETEDKEDRTAKENQDRMLHTENTKRAVEKAMPEFSSMIDEVASLATEDGVPAKAVAAFKADPYGSSDAPYLLNFARRVLIARELKEAQDKIATLKTDPDDVAAKIEEAANRKPKIKKSSTARETKGDNLTEEDIANMSDEELDKRLKGG